MEVGHGASSEIIDALDVHLCLQNEPLGENGIINCLSQSVQSFSIRDARAFSGAHGKQRTCLDSLPKTIVWLISSWLKPDEVIYVARTSRLVQRMHVKQFHGQTRKKTWKATGRSTP